MSTHTPLAAISAARLTGLSGAAAEATEAMQLARKHDAQIRALQGLNHDRWIANGEHDQLRKQEQIEVVSNRHLPTHGQPTVRSRCSLTHSFNQSHTLIEECREDQASAVRV